MELLDRLHFLFLLSVFIILSKLIDIECNRGLPNNPLRRWSRLPHAMLIPLSVLRLIQIHLLVFARLSSFPRDLLPLGLGPSLRLNLRLRLL
jgi:hypothetical protein